MPESVAFIDVGTNSIHLLIVSFYEGSLGTPVFSEKESVRMGKSLYETGRIDDETLEKARVVLSKFAQISQEKGCSEIIAMATCAAREAPNRADLVNVARECGITLHVIPGREEARLTRLGVAGPDCPRRTLCIDVGGGSTEIALALGRDDIYLDSLNLGAIRMAFGTGIDQNGKVSPKQYDTLKKMVAAQCYHSVGKIRDIGFDVVMGSSGTMEALADACASMRGDGDGSFLLRSELKSLMKIMCGLTAAERCKLPKVSANRADIVIGGGSVVEALMDLLDIERIEISRTGLREGMKVDYLLKKGHSDCSIRASSVMALAVRCECNTKHEEAVKKYTSQLYGEFVRVGLVQESPEMEELLGYAAQLHDVGAFISYDKHNAFSYTIIKNSYLAGFDSDELERIALLARFHHNSFPGPSSKFFVGMDRKSAQNLLKYAMILKIADILDRGRDFAVEEIRVEVLNGNVNLTVYATADMSMAMWKLGTVVEDFRTLFGGRLSAEFVRS
ncbi:MAG: Ppx/GppA family phosphatase [archaeon]|nr:Ppx/GppA family phosphatase [archaeon]